MSRWGWSPYVPVAQQRIKARKEMDKLRKKGKCILPVEITGRTIARSFWGKGWCGHLESFSDYENRLPRGRRYVRNGSVCHLDIEAGRIESMVSGSSMYKVSIQVKALPGATWEDIKARCAGRIGSVLELLQGRLSDEVMTIVADRQSGLFPQPGEFSFSCSCPDWASMCKHVAATLYGVGHRLDSDPALLFELRGVDAGELIATELILPDSATTDQADVLREDSLADIFGIELDTGVLHPPTRTATDVPPAAPKKGAVPKTSRDKTVKPPRKKPSKPKTSRPFMPTGPRIRKLRTDAGLSAAEFALRLGVSLPTVYRWESIQGTCTLHKRCLDVLRKMHAEVMAASGG